MHTLVKKIYLIENLGCANCAAKIEASLPKITGIEQAQLNFVTKKIQIYYDPNIITDPTSLQQDISKLANSIEKGVTIIDPSIQTNPLLAHSHPHINCNHCCSEHTHNHSHESHKQHTQNHPHEPYKEHTHSHSGMNSEKSLGLQNKAKILYWLVPMVIGVFISFLGLRFIQKSPLQLVIILIGYTIAGHKVLLCAINTIKSGSIFDENVLVVIATLGAFYIQEYPEAIAVMVLFQLGEFFQDLAVDRSRKHLTKAMNLKPEYATIELNNDLKQVAPESVSIGDIIVIKPKEKIPLDGIVIEGTSFIDTSSLTGESVPRKVTVADEILSGCLNGEQLLKIKVTKPYEESTVAKILDLVENASSRKSATENFITKFARIYTPTVVVLALLIAIFPPLITKSYDFSTWIYSACGFLVVSCPCALVISVPLGFFGGIGNASKNGIIVKGSNYLEALTKVKHVIFDKTGTLTKGTFDVREVIPYDNRITQDQLLYLSALLESCSTHPIATSIVTSYKNRTNDILDVGLVSQIQEISGLGIQGSIHGHRYFLGNRRMMETNAITDIPSIDTMGTIVYLANNKNLLGYLIISDEIKKDCQNTIASLNSQTIETILLTGDTHTVAIKVANSLGINKVYDQLLPTDKVKKLEEIISTTTSNELVAFVGDGINDAPVIARADIGIAMGGVGSDAAIEAADIVLMTDEPSKIVKAIHIANYTKKIVTQNIILSLGIKVIVLLLLALGLGSMWLAVFADVGVSLIAILNSVRVLNS